MPPGLRRILVRIQGALRGASSLSVPLNATRNTGQKTSKMGALFLATSLSFFKIKTTREQVRHKQSRFLSDKNNMYINTQPAPVLTFAIPAEMVVERGTESQPLKLLPFQIVRAMVAEGGMDKVVLNLKQHHLTAETKVPLKTGQNLRLQVINTHPQIQFKIMEEPELKHLFRALHLIHHNIKFPSLIQHLQNWQSQNVEPFSDKMQNLLQSLKGLLQTNPGQMTGKNLSMLWNLLGLDLEALLAAGKRTQAKNGLKTALLMHMMKLQKAGKSSETIENALEQFKLYQICRYRLAQENLWFVPLPFSFLEQGYLLAEKWKQNDHNSSKKNHFWKMTINLKMSSLGNLQISLFFKNMDLRLRILCDSHERAEIISRSLTHLKDNLTTVSLLNFSVGTGAQDPGRWLVQRLAQDDKPFLNAEV